MEALKFASFGFSHPGAEPLFSGIDGCLEEGSFTLLVGPTGSGKTTLLRCLKPQLAPTGIRKGTITFFSRPLDALDERECAEQIGYVGQNPDTQVICDSVWHELAFGLENVGTPPATMRRRIAEVAHFFGLEPLIHEKPSKLSGGQKQLVALASALALQPRLLLLDEPTAQLDPIAEKDVIHALFRVNRELGITVIVATHSPHSIRDYASDALILKSHQAFIASPADAVAYVGAAQLPLPSLALFDKLPSTELTRSTSDPVLQLEKVRFGYERNRLDVLRDLNLTLCDGGIHAIVGGNGCGKSTLLHVMAQVLKPRYGKVTSLYRHHQALLPQNPKSLFVCDTVKEELEEWRDPNAFCADDTVAMSTVFGLADLLERHPYDLSGGQQQLLALGKLIMTNPQLLICDEPTKGLDAYHRRLALSILKMLHEQGRTIVLATHDLSCVRELEADVSLIFDGEVACMQPAEEFFAQSILFGHDTARTECERESR